VGDPVRPLADATDAATQRRELEIAKAGLDALERDLKALIEGDLAKLEEAFAAAGAPWPPGRRLPWA